MRFLLERQGNSFDATKRILLRLIVESEDSYTRDPDAPKWFERGTGDSIIVTSYEWEWKTIGGGNDLAPFGSDVLCYERPYMVDLRDATRMAGNLSRIAKEWKKLNEKAGYAATWVDCVRRLASILNVKRFEMSPDLLRLVHPYRAKHLTGKDKDDQSLCTSDSPDFFAPVGRRQWEVEARKEKEESHEEASAETN